MEKRFSKLQKYILPATVALILMVTGVTAIAEGTTLIQMDENNVWINKQSKGAIHYTSSDGNEVIFDASDLDVLAKNITEKATSSNPEFTGSISMGRYNGSSIGEASTALGQYNTASGRHSLATGTWNKTTGQDTVAGGYDNEVTGNFSSALGTSNRVTGTGAFAAGGSNKANGDNSIALGYANIADGLRQTVIGEFNESDTNKAFIIGNGTVANSGTIRSNAATVDWDGNAKFAGEVEDGNGNKLSDVGNFANDIEEINNSLGMQIRVNSETGKPEWKAFGADAWSPFSSAPSTLNISFRGTIWHAAENRWTIRMTVNGVTQSQDFQGDINGQTFNFYIQTISCFLF